MAARVLVAGVGNLFLGDDGFGPEVVRRLAEQGTLPPGVRVVDYGIRGMHLAYDLLDTVDAWCSSTPSPAEGAPARWWSSRSPRATWATASSTRTAWTRWRCWPA